MAKKTIYEFAINKEREVRVEKQRVNDNQETETVVVTEKQDIPVRFAIEKPTRKLADKAELFYSVQLSKAIKAGIVTKAMLVKKYADNGGALSEEETTELLKKMRDIQELENEYKLVATSEDEDKAEKLKSIEKNIAVLRRDLINLESSLQSVYEHTADAKAERDTLIWYVIQLSKIVDEEGNRVDFFSGLNYEEQLEDFYNKYESDDLFDVEAAATLSRAVGFWFYSQDASQDDIEKFVVNDEV